MVTRISGINSGMDIDSLVTKLMTAEKIPQNTMKQKQQLLSWQQDAYRSINSLVASLRDATNNMRFAANLQTTAATSSDPTKVTVSSSGNAVPGTHTLDVLSLAKGGYQNGTAGISTLGLSGSDIVGTTVPTVPISAANGNNQINVTLNGVQKTITLADNTAGYTQAALKTALQSALDQAFGANQIVVGNSASGNGLSLTPQGSNPPQLMLSNVGTGNGVGALGFINGQSYKIDPNAALNSVNNTAKIGSITAGSFQINGQTISYSASDSLQAIMTRVNTSAAGVTMSYDSISDKVSIVTKNTGSAATISLSGDTGNLLTTLKFNAAVAPPVAGTDANIKLDGLTTTQPSNNFTVNGITYNLLNTTSQTIQINVQQDTASLKKTITDFVDKYNTLITTLSAKTSETKFQDYQPLTDDQKAAMTDSQITAWNQKAQSGILHSDPLLKKAYSDLRNAVDQSVTGVTGSYKSLSDIGIATGQYSLNDPTSAGKLIIDQSKLDTALATDPQGVINLFSKIGTVNTTTGVDDRGVAQKLNDISNSFVSSLVQKAGSVGGSYIDVTTTLGKQEYDLTNKINDFSAKLTSKEDYYYQMFSKMDTAIGNSNAQIAYLQSALK